MTCRELIEFLADYLEGHLPEPQRAEFEAHLAECPWCVDYLKTYRETIRLGKTALAPTAETTPDSVPEKLVQAILAARAKGKH